jgi:hypothetical protein
MTDKAIKIYRNPERHVPDKVKPYTPQYVIEGKDPVPYQKAKISGNAIVMAKPNPLPIDNPRARRVPLQQPYAVPAHSPIGNSGLPNVGNNMEQTWSSVDGMVDDLSEIDLNQPLIDNNETVSAQALGYQSGFTADNLQTPAMQGQVVIEQATPVLSSGEDLFPVLHDLEDNSFLLIVSGVPICSGPQTEIEDQAKALVFGEHEMCGGSPIPVEDLLIVKRVKVKVGLFFD